MPMTSGIHRFFSTSLSISLSLSRQIRRIESQTQHLAIAGALMDALICMEENRSTVDAFQIRCARDEK